MANKKSKAREFSGMSYHEVQRINSNNRTQLYKEDKKWLKDNDYYNVGWNNVIKLFQKLEELLDKERLKDLTLEELFLETDRIGNKYLSNQEIEEFNQKLSKKVNEVAEEIEKQFSDVECEVIDFSGEPNNKPRKKHNQKTYRTVKL